MEITEQKQLCVWDKTKQSSTIRVAQCSQSFFFFFVKETKHEHFQKVIICLSDVMYQKSLLLSSAKILAFIDIKLCLMKKHAIHELTATSKA